MTEIDKKTKIAIVLVLTVPLGMALFLLFQHPQKPARPVRIHQSPQVTEFVGVGIALRMGTQPNTPIIQDVVANTPAAEAGITRGMVVSKVDGVPVEGKNLADCVNLIRGPVGTTVQLELITPDMNQTNTVELTRKKLKLQNGR